MENPSSTPHRSLNALLDGELPPEEAQRLARSLEHNPLLRQRLMDLRRVHHLTRQALNDDLARPQMPRRSSARVALAAGVAVLLAFTAGWWAGATGNRASSVLAAAMPTEAGTEETRVILHLASENSARMKHLLDKAESILASHADAGRGVQLEVVANGGGLNLLRADTSPERARIQALQQRYANVTFLACRKTLEQLKLQRGIDAPLLPRVIVIPSALDQIVERLQNGWTYVQA